MKVAFLTGITGMDGSYLTEYLLDKGYDVWGMIRRCSNLNTTRIDHIFHHPRLFLRYGELIDSSSLHRMFSEIEQRYGEDLERLEFYNLGAMSHVRVSFDEPEYTAQTDGVGVLKCLELILHSNMRDKIRFYQASTSELFGKVQEIPQTETTPFYPRSPYAVAKLFGYWTTKNYREAYGLFACNGILFNHESVPGGSPILYRRSDGRIDIRPIREMETEGVEVLDDGGWTRVQAVSHYRSETKTVFPIRTQTASLDLTTGHPVILANGMDKYCQDVTDKDVLMTIGFRYTEKPSSLSVEACEWIGRLYHSSFSSYEDKMMVHHEDEEDRIMMLFLWTQVCGRRGYQSQPDRTVFTLPDTFPTDFWNQDGTVRIPREILNGDRSQREAFLTGFGTTFPSGTFSPTLLQGLIYLSGEAHVWLGRVGDRTVVSDPSTVDYYDVMTASGRFHCGLGDGLVHNSPRRGATFVTRKITLGLNKILRGETDRLVLGNLDAQRDWGHARDYCEGMWRILQHDEPDDYVLATNETHSVREFVETSFALRGIEIGWKGEGVDEVGYDKETGRDLIFIHPKYFRPAEVDLLIGDATKARDRLGWRPTIRFDELVCEMVNHDCPID